MFSDDRFLTLATGLVLAIVVGTIAQQSDTLMSFFTGEKTGVAVDDQYTVRAGKDQILDVLSNDSLEGEIQIVEAPRCGTVIPSSTGVNFVDSGSCIGTVNFVYCVDFEEICVSSNVTLTVINEDKEAEQQEELLAAAEAENRPTIDAEALIGLSPEEQQEFVEERQQEQLNPATEETTEIANNTTNIPDDRFTPNQIVLQDDGEDVAVVGFGGNAAPSLFAPDTSELIQPQETVDELKRSVASIATVTLDQDQTIGTQTSASTPNSVALNTTDLQSGLPVGTEAAPTVAFAAPSQPSLGGAPSLLAPAQPSANVDSAFSIEYGPDVDPTPPEPTQLASNATAPEPVEVPNEVDNLVVDALAAADPLVEQQPADQLQNVDTQTAAAGDVSVEANDPADSSDIVVEMAAQILLPGPQLVDSVDRGDQVTPETGALLSDELFVANLDESSPSSDTTELASLTSPTDTVPIIGGQQTASCPVEINSAARPGASISLLVTSVCRPGQIVNVEHAGLTFNLRMDDNGRMTTSIPAFESTAVVNVSFDDGVSEQVRIVVRDADDIQRVAIIWSAPVPVDLHAFEGGAAEESDGHVWEQNPRRYRDTLTGGGGYLETFGDESISGGYMAEVYSLPVNRLRQQNGIRMELRVDDATGYCGQKMPVWTVQTGDSEATKRAFSLPLPECGAAATAGLVVENFVDEISLANN